MPKTINKLPNVLPLDTILDTSYKVYCNNGLVLNGTNCNPISVRLYINKIISPNRLDAEWLIVHSSSDLLTDTYFHFNKELKLFIQKQQ